MIRNMLKSVVMSLLFAAVLLGGYSCSDDDPSGDYLTEAQVRQLIQEALQNSGNNLSEEELRELVESIVEKNLADMGFSELKIVNISVENGQWKWNADNKSYLAVYDLPELTEDIYENGAVIGYVFMGVKDQDEVQKLLPFVKTYEEGGETFTETISFDVQYKKDEDVSPSVAFYIQTSDLFGGPEYEEFLPLHNFRLVMLW